jgi:hypothetical protein
MQEVTKMANDHIADDRKKVRLIDANALIAEYDRVHIGSPGAARKLMEDAPTVDAVEVCRCKDCKHYKPRNRSARWDCKTPCCNRSAALKFPEDGFCSYGERRTE